MLNRVMAKVSKIVRFLRPKSFSNDEIQSLRIAVSRGGKKIYLKPSEYDSFDFQDNDELSVIPTSLAGC